VSGGLVGPRVETQAGIVFGTADFLAPERLLAKGDSDPRSDIYSAGVILYEALTGERPFHDDDPYTTVQRALKESLRPPSTFVPDLPAALDAVVARAMARDPDERYQTPREMLAALDPLVRKAPTGSLIAPLPPVPEPFPDAAASGSPLALYSVPQLRPRRKYLLWLALPAAVVVVVAMTAGGGEAPISPFRPPAPEPAARPANQQAELAAMVKQAAEGETVAERQRAFDRLVALGYGDRVPWVPMLARDLVQLPTCEERREVAGRMKKLNDPGAIPYLQQAAARAENACFAGDVRASAATGEPAPQPAKKKRSRRGGGGHF
jgi:hypothetical protein